MNTNNTKDGDYFFIAVNYGTSNLISKWSENIYNLKKDAILVIVDNYKNKAERQRVSTLCDKYSIHFIENQNTGYGSAINIAIKYCESKYSNDKIYFAGNLDLIFKQIPENVNNFNVAYIPDVIENGNRNRNPFLTKLQAKFYRNFKFASYFNSNSIYIMLVIINKLLKFIPSPVWTVHGSLFVFGSSVLSNKDVFNNNSFLYMEELEFGAFLESESILLIDSDVVVEHLSHVSTSDIVSSRKNYMAVWSNSFNHWYKRWI
jgi:hypothetical protein